MWRHGMDRAGSAQGEAEGSCKCRNEPFEFHKMKEFLDKLKTGLLLKKDSAPWSE
jgi:hypothetical protein